MNQNPLASKRFASFLSMLIVGILSAALQNRFVEPGGPLRLRRARSFFRQAESEAALRALASPKRQRSRCKTRANLQLETTPVTSSTLQDRRELATPMLQVAITKGR
jgi:hypothetical protein